MTLFNVLQRVNVHIPTLSRTASIFQPLQVPLIAHLLTNTCSAFKIDLKVIHCLSDHHLIKFSHSSLFHKHLKILKLLNVHFVNRLRGNLLSSSMVLIKWSDLQSAIIYKEILFLIIYVQFLSRTKVINPCA